MALAISFPALGYESIMINAFLVEGNEHDFVYRLSEWCLLGPYDEWDFCVEVCHFVLRLEAINLRFIAGCRLVREGGRLGARTLSATRHLLYSVEFYNGIPLRHASLFHKMGVFLGNPSAVR